MEIHVTDRRRAGKMLMSTATSDLITHLVSFGTWGREQRPPAGFYHHPCKKIRFQFDDIARDSDFGVFTPPMKEDIEKLIAFYNEEVFTHEDPVVLIHCFAGQSRSTTAALILLFMKMGDATEAFYELKRIRPIASPNKRMIRFADEILEKSGEFFREAEYAKMAYNPNKIMDKQ